MSTEVSSIDLSPMFNELREGMERYLPDSSERGRTILESSAILQVSYASLKNISYAFLTPGFGIETIKHLYSRVITLDLRPVPKALKSLIQTLLSPDALAARVTYLEATSMAMVSVVHNLFFAVLYTFLSVVTLGFSKNLNLRCRIHWSHFTYGLVAVGIGGVGVLSPYCGVSLNLLHMLSLVRGFNRSYQIDVNLFERPLLQKIKEIVQKYRETIHFYTRAKVEDSRYVKFYAPSLWHIERRISVAKRMDDLFELIDDVRRQWPKVGLLDAQKPQDLPTKTGSPAAHDHYE